MNEKRTFEKVQRRERIVWAVVYSASWIIFLVGMVDFFRYTSNEEAVLAAGLKGAVQHMGNFFVSFFVCLYVLCRLDFHESEKRRFVKKASFLLSLVDLSLRVIASMVRATIQAVWIAGYYVKQEAISCLNSNLDRLIEEESIRRGGNLK